MKTKRLIILAVSAIVVAGTGIIIFRKSASQEIAIETAAASIGSISNTVTATGTIEPIDKIAVGTQVSGVIKKIYVDFNSIVKKGQLIAELDRTLLKSQVLQSEASLHAALNELNFQKKNVDRTGVLHSKSMVSDEELDQASYSLEQAVAGEEKALVELERARSNLSYATIYSPIDGIILSRAVDEGQTVAASLNAPTLFTIARDLTKMEVQVDVDEADIGLVKQDQQVQFTVDAYPEKTFAGRVSQVRLEPKVVSNVVTYTVIVEAENPDKLLLPGMTASITITTSEVENAVIIPAKALMFKPDFELMQQYTKQQGMKPLAMPGNDGKHDRMQFPHAQGTDKKKNQARVWIKQDGILKPIRIKTGISDGTSVQVIEGLSSGIEVIIAMERKSNSKNSGASPSANNNNPFMPRFGHRRTTGGR